MTPLRAALTHDIGPDLQGMSGLVASAVRAHCLTLPLPPHTITSGQLVEALLGPPEPGEDTRIRRGAYALLLRLSATDTAPLRPFCRLLHVRGKFGWMDRRLWFNPGPDVVHSRLPMTLAERVADLERRVGVLENNTVTQETHHG